MKTRPAFLKSWREIELPGPHKSHGGESLGYPAFFSNVTGLSRLNILHLRLPPGTRSGPPGASRDEEEFVFVLKGTPDLWIDGNLYRLAEGDGAAFNDRTGIAHTLINNTEEDVHLFVFGEGARMFSQFACPLDADAPTNTFLRKQGRLWQSAPTRKLGPNSGKPGDLSGRKRGKPDYVANWRDILGKDEGGYPNSAERHGIDALYGRRARFSRIGVHAEVLPSSRRTSFPHAERDEEEWVYVVSGTVQCWINGWLHEMREGDFVGFEARTDITHAILNNSGEDAVLLVGAEAARSRNQFWYPNHPHRDKETGELFWADHPKAKLGPHDGLPDALRARLPKAALKNPVTANRAAMKVKMPKWR
ncbi:MAG TPA: cupin domain-containing protein [Rhizomicrobium sp.]|jgi:uncharacterized cupin superfamily protein|nr:cupin domain-containing protein [Rhizomicrobium sp.]